MSRIGKKPVEVPAGVTVTIDGTHVAVKGSKGELDRHFSELVTVAQEGEEILVTRNDDSTESNAQQGLVRTLINNMVVGVSAGFEKKLELTGVGYRAVLKGKDLEKVLYFVFKAVLKKPDFLLPITTITWAIVLHFEPVDLNNGFAQINIISTIFHIFF